MNKRVDTLLEEARKLTLLEREQLLLRLHLEFDGSESDGSPDDVEAAWAEEVRQRIAKAERGETNSLPHEQVMFEMRGLIRRP